MYVQNNRTNFWQASDVSLPSLLSTCCWFRVLGALQCRLRLRGWEAHDDVVLRQVVPRAGLHDHPAAADELAAVPVARAAPRHVVERRRIVAHLHAILLDLLALGQVYPKRHEYHLIE